MNSCCTFKWLTLLLLCVGGESSVPTSVVDFICECKNKKRKHQMHTKHRQKYYLAIKVATSNYDLSNFLFYLEFGHYYDFVPCHYDLFDVYFVLISRF